MVYTAACCRRQTVGEKGIAMKLNAPKVVTFWICAVLIVLGIIGHFIPLDIISAISFWCLAVGAALLAVACAVKGL